MYRHGSVSVGKVISTSRRKAWSISFQSEEVGRQRAQREFAQFTESQSLWEWLYTKSANRTYTCSRSLYHPNSLS